MLITDRRLTLDSIQSKCSQMHASKIFFKKKLPAHLTTKCFSTLSLFRKLNGYCYDAALPGVLSSAVPRLKALADAIGEVSKVTPLWAHVNLVGGAEGRIHITDARDMYSRSVEG